MAWWLAPLAILVGLAMGALGGGGAIIAVPVLVYLAQQSPAAAMTGSLIVVSVTALAGLVGHWRAGHVRATEGVAFAALGTVGAVGGSVVSMRLPGDLLMTLFALLLLVVAGVMGRKYSRKTAPQSTATPPPILSRRPLRINWDQSARVAAAATGVGLLTGFFGVGGGFATVPALVFALGFSMQHAVATSLLVIVGNSLVSLATRVVGAVEIDWWLIAPFSVLAAAAAVVGGNIGRRLPTRALGLGFTALLAVASVLMLAQSLLWG